MLCIFSCDVNLCALQ